MAAPIESASSAPTPAAGRSPRAPAHTDRARRTHPAGRGDHPSGERRCDRCNLRAPSAYGDARELIADPEVDLVSICVKVPHHHELAKAALQAGKHVFCEWPLGANLDQAAELETSLAAYRNGVGLQGRMSPIANYARDLVTEGYVGEVQAVNLISRSADAAATR